jgi:hypothetical protein
LKQSLGASRRRDSSKSWLAAQQRCRSYCEAVEFCDFTAIDTPTLRRLVEAFEDDAGC